MDDDQATLLTHEVADFQHGHAVPGGADGHRELVVTLVGVVQDGVAECVQDVLVRRTVLVCGVKDVDSHLSKVTCRPSVSQVTLPPTGGEVHGSRSRTSVHARGSAPERRCGAVSLVCIDWCPRGDKPHTHTASVARAERSVIAPAVHVSSVRDAHDAHQNPVLVDRVDDAVLTPTRLPVARNRQAKGLAYPGTDPRRAGRTRRRLRRRRRPREGPVRSRALARGERTTWYRVWLMRDGRPVPRAPPPRVHRSWP